MSSIKRRLPVSELSPRPIYVVWELTLACDQPCTHCGSRAGEAREKEISTEKALSVVDQLKDLGTEEIALIGGEAYLHPGFLTIARAISDAGMRVTMTTGGRNIDARRAKEMASAGFYSVSVSLDGTESTHDRMRASKGSFVAAKSALHQLREAGVAVTANTNFNRFNLPDLEALYEILSERDEHGQMLVRGWQVQVTAPLGRAADRADMLLQPYDYLDMMPRLAAVKNRANEDGLVMLLGNNLGYFGPEEGLLRSPAGKQDHFRGCFAGRFLMGIESDGAIKGCPSLQTEKYVGGNVHDASVRAVWDDAPILAFTRRDRVDELWGFCGTCPFGEVCQGGCSFTAESILGRRGNNPYCSFRARSLAARALRERLVPAERAPGLPFDNGRFSLVEEPLDAAEPPPPPRKDLVKIRRAPAS
jgi:radical SAM protein with 4Fe4S-binding SPASM domain